ncbi:MAG: hypothetical protein WDO19_06990 [Bacteroidota bacterium]
MTKQTETLPQKHQNTDDKDQMDKNGHLVIALQNEPLKSIHPVAIGSV